MKKFLLTILILNLQFSIPNSLAAQTQIALLKYGGGGDWYANPTSLTNLIAFCNADAHMNLATDYAIVDVGSSQLFNHPFVHMTGHGNVVFNSQERQNLRNYLLGGGFLHIDDNYGIKDYILPQMKLVFPELEFVELPSSHPIFHQKYHFPDGLPKIHEHDNLPPRAYGLFYEGRLICLFTWECDLGDGWEDPDVHNDSQATRQKAFRMGENILQYVFTH